MKKILISTLLIALLFLTGWEFFSFGTGTGYSQYLTEWEYRRLHPEFLPSPTVVRTFDMGHSSSYASLVWLELIQYIGDNVGENRYLNFSHTLLVHITTLHPYFTRPYEIDLILAPTSLGENMSPEIKKQNQIATNNAIELGKNGMNTLCDTRKIDAIKKEVISEKLWNNTALKNPCASGMLPYYIAFATYQMGNNRAESSEYYKIASMNDDAPKVSGLLGILALSADGDYRASAMNFALIGTTGYDTEPYACRNIATELVTDLTAKRIPNSSWIQDLEKKEKQLTDKPAPNNIISGAGDNCYDMTTRSIEALYLNHIADIARGTVAKNGDDLIKMGLLKSIPTISTKKGYTVREKQGIWEYQSRN